MAGGRASYAWLGFGVEAMVSDWFVAGGTLGLAGGTVWLVIVTNRMVARAGDQLALEQRRVEASQRPHVYPESPIEWVDGTGRYGGPLTWREALPVRNGGPGVALNVRGKLFFPPPSGVVVPIVPTSLAPGESADLRFNWGGERQKGGGTGPGATSSTRTSPA